MTPQQRKTLSFIHHYHANNGYGPSHREMCAHLSLKSPSGPARITKFLYREGYVDRSRFESRTLRPSVKGLRALGITNCPTCGQPTRGKENEPTNH